MVILRFVGFFFVGWGNTSVFLFVVSAFSFFLLVLFESSKGFDLQSNNKEVQLEGIWYKFRGGEKSSRTEC